MVRSACRAALASPPCRAASTREPEAWLKAMDISPLHFEDSKPHHAVSTAVSESMINTTVSLTWPGGRFTGSSLAGVVGSDRSSRSPVVVITHPSPADVHGSAEEHAGDDAEEDQAGEHLDDGDHPGGLAHRSDVAEPHRGEHRDREVESVQTRHRLGVASRVPQIEQVVSESEQQDEQRS